MTCIVAVKQDGDVFMGGDSAGVAGLSLQVRNDAKVWAKNGFVFGFTSSFRMGQLLRFTFKPPVHHADIDDYEYMVSDFIEAVRACLTKGGYAETKDKVESGGTFLVGYKGEIYLIEDDYQVGMMHDDYAAVGCGHAYAKGSMYALRMYKLNPEEKLTIALEAAENHSAGVRGPWVFAKILKTGKGQ